MIEFRRPWLVVALGAFVALAGCRGGRDSAAPSNLPDAPSVGVYQGRFQHAEQRDRRFKVLLFAALPDRIHAEVLSPMGRTEMILDGGAGRVAITVVPEGVSFVGEGGPGSLERVLGVPLGLEALVRGLLTGERIERGYGLVRSGTEPGDLPESLEIHTPRSMLSLELKRIRGMRTLGQGVGTGEPPSGTEVRPLDQLPPWQEQARDEDSS